MDPVEEVKSRLDIVDAVQEYLPLKPAGSGSFKGLCPFHHEKTPSFYANRPRQSWHCFGCDIGGDVISFVMKMEGMEFREALELLAQKAGVELPAFDPTKTTEKKRLHEVNDLASRWFRAILLKNPRAEIARAYVAKRGIDGLTGDLWRIGYAPDGWSNLTDALKEKGVTEEDLLKAGLVGKSERGSIYDRFRDRLMFTICDVHGNPVGFTGRILDTPPPVIPTETQRSGGIPSNDHRQEAKYVNTPETVVYKKSLILYGLDKAKGDIKRQDLAVIVEGNMDVVSSHQFGVTNVVASSGTALTGDQLNLLKRFTRRLAIAFDADAAGNAATIRGLDLARGMDFDIRVITLAPEAGKDPDDAIRKDVALWKDAIAGAVPIVEWLYRNAFRGKDLHTPEGKKAIARTILPEFRRIHDAVERDAWIERLADDLTVSADALRDALRTTSAPSPTHGSGEATRKQRTDGRPLADDAHPKKTREEMLRERVLAILEIRPELRSLAESILTMYPLRLEEGQDVSRYLAILADREFEDQGPSRMREEMMTSAKALRDEFLARERRRLEEEMREAELAGDTARIGELLTRYRTFNT
ncbi:CHC2 zinc finger domain-containing protein [Candidatus Uhrbacteria bacterium]|nr:CHC2 zinc finger domain-containing protein [Candidatus Uhrbacteria bacterium]